MPAPYLFCFAAYDPDSNIAAYSKSGNPELYYHYVAQNYWVFGLCPSSGILTTSKYDVSETGSVSILR
jgi:hypothetical protein